MFISIFQSSKQILNMLHFSKHKDLSIFLPYMDLYTQCSRKRLTIDLANCLIFTFFCSLESCYLMSVPRKETRVLLSVLIQNAVCKVTQKVE